MPPHVVHLQCTRGQPAPAELADDVAELLALPDSIKADFWPVVAPYLDDELAVPDAEPLQQRCARAGLKPMALTPALRGARFLVVQAARTALDDSAFVADLSKLVGIHQIRELIALLLPCYERAYDTLRRAIVERTVAEHGKLVRDVALRVDRVASSAWGGGTELPVAVLTVRYREGADRSVTLHLLPEQLAALASACDELLDCP